MGMGNAMEDNEKNKLEERILAYFDGALDKQSSKQLLAEVAKSSEKRTLFQSHEMLNRIISAARVPLETPIEAKRSIAERIPALLAFIPGLLGTAETLPILTQSANPFIAFFTKIPLSTAISVGASVAVLTTAGVVVKNKLDDNAAREHKSRVAVVQNNTILSTPQAYAVLPQTNIRSLPSRNLAMPNLGSAGTSANVVSGSSASGITTSKPTQNLNTSIPPSPGILKDKLPPGGVNHMPAGEISSAVMPSAIAGNSSRSDSNIHEVLLASVQPVPANIMPPNSSVLYPLPMNLVEGLIVRPYANGGLKVIMLPNISEVNSNPRKTASGPTLAWNSLFGLDFLIDESFAYHVQVGSGQFAQIAYHNDYIPSVSSVPAYAYDKAVDLNQSWWTTVGASWMLNPNDAFRVILSADAGAAWLHPIAPMAGLGLATEIDLSSRFTIRPGVTFDAVWTQADGSHNAALPPSVIIQNEEFGPTGLFSTSIGFNIGFMLRY
jgi:hypothetical protein